MTGQSHLFLKVITGLVVATAATAAVAQETAAAPQSDGATEPTEVVVTGSRIARRDYEANSPIVNGRGFAGDGTPATPAVHGGYECE
jgi:hypothetical protein